MLADPVAAGQRAEQGAVELAGMAVVVVFEGSGLFEMSLAQPGGGSPIFAPEPLGIHQLGEPLLEAERMGIGLLKLVFEGLSHAMKFQAGEFFKGLFAHQGTSG